MDGHDRERDFVKVLSDSISAGIGIGAGAVGGPEVAALVGSGLTHPLELLFDRGRQLFYRNANTMMSMAADELGMTSEEFVQHASDSNVRLLLTIDAIRASSRTAWEHKVMSLSKVLRDGFSDDALLDELPLVVAAINAIEVPHVAVLDYLDQATTEIEPNVAGTSTAKVREHLPRYSAGLASILATLQGHGLIAAGNAFLGSGKGREHDELWVSTPFAVTVLRYLRENGNKLSA